MHDVWTRGSGFRKEVAVRPRKMTAEQCTGEGVGGWGEAGRSVDILEGSIFMA